MCLYKRKMCGKQKIFANEKTLINKWKQTKDDVIQKIRFWYTKDKFKSGQPIALAFVYDLILCLFAKKLVIEKCWNLN